MSKHVKKVITLETAFSKLLTQSNVEHTEAPYTNFIDNTNFKVRVMKYTE